MTERKHEQDAARTGREDRDDRDRRKDRDERDDDGRRVVDEGTPLPKGLTSPGEGMDDEPVEPRQSKDYV
ncbi:hypothetical protein [Actinacidiphila acidipaludis]|uniref:Uncharacterized protein n=1 Tax=Actinacidiphila acidipaludis TaxID=2873382 RepID=A0ABS7QE78_9ACTN|nr:hypothetical protein [Streptomyces acidipaludis]MBY8881483.1 hypothetical protein [Streptomyces acidipaludis]